MNSNTVSISGTNGTISNIKDTNMYGFSNTFIVIEGSGYGQKIALPFSTQLVDALTNAVVIDTSYDSAVSDYRFYKTDKKLNINIMKIDRFEKAPPSEQEEINALEEERAKLFKAAEELNQQINAKLNK